MSKIEHRTQNKAVLTVYTNILQEKIHVVCHKIGFDDSKITWVIFNPNEGRSKDILDHIKIICRDEEKAFCFPSKKEIWISTSLIMEGENASQKNKIREMLKLSNKEGTDFFANILIDEITHIQTDCDHGSAEYEQKFQDNLEKYYSLG